RRSRPAGISFRIAHLLDRAPGAAVRSQTAHEYLGAIVGIDIRPHHVNGVIIADDQIVVESFRRRVPVDPRARGECFPSVVRNTVIDSSFLFGAALGEPTDMNPAPLILTDGWS